MRNYIRSPVILKVVKEYAVILSSIMVPINMAHKNLIPILCWQVTHNYVSYILPHRLFGFYYQIREYLKQLCPVVPVRMKICH